MSSLLSLDYAITNNVIAGPALPRRFAEISAVVKGYMVIRCFGRTVDLNAQPIRSHLSPLEIQEGIAKYLARVISELTVERRAIEFAKADFRKPSGAIGFYHPDCVVVQRVGGAEVNWIIETKAHVWEGTTAKDEAIRDWCARMSDSTGSRWRYERVNQTVFEAACPSMMADVVL
jgi:hypothetical protein